MGYWHVSFWWIVGIAAVLALGLADARLGTNNPLERLAMDFRNVSLWQNISAYAFGFVGTLAGLSLMYFIGVVFS